jgi:hypothetical protein
MLLFRSAGTAEQHTDAVLPFRQNVTTAEMQHDAEREEQK